MQTNHPAHHTPALVIVPYNDYTRCDTMRYDTMRYDSWGPSLFFFFFFCFCFFFFFFFFFRISNTSSSKTTQKGRLPKEHRSKTFFLSFPPNKPHHFKTKKKHQNKLQKIPPIVPYPYDTSSTQLPARRRNNKFRYRHFPSCWGHNLPYSTAVCKGNWEDFLTRSEWVCSRFSSHDFFPFQSILPTGNCTCCICLVRTTNPDLAR